MNILFAHNKQAILHNSDWSQVSIFCYFY